MRRLAIPILLLASWSCPHAGTMGTRRARSTRRSATSRPTHRSRVAIETDLESGQYEAVSSILDRFPFGGQVREGLKAEIEEGGEVDFDADVRPLLGNELVVGAPDTEALAEDSESFLAALQVADADKARELLDAAPELAPAGEASGASIWEEESGTAIALEEDVLVTTTRARGSSRRWRGATAPTASPRRRSSSRSRTFPRTRSCASTRTWSRSWARAPRRSGLGRSPGSRPSASSARPAPPTARDSSSTLPFRSDPAGLTDEDLPIASGAEPASVVGREGQIAVGVRDAGQIERFIEAVAGVADPGKLGQLDTAKKQIGRRLGIDIERDLVDQLSGETTISAGLDKSFGLRIELADPESAERTLEQLTQKAPAIGKAFDLDEPAITRPGKERDFYGLATTRGDRAVFGVVDDVFVLAQDPAQAGELAAADPGTLPGASGSVVMQADAEAIATEIASRELEGVEGLGAGLFTGPLGQLDGLARGRDRRPSGPRAARDRVTGPRPRPAAPGR